MSKITIRPMRQLRLKHQFRIMIVCILCLVGLLQLYYITGFSNLMTKRAMDTTSRQMTQVAQNINDAMTQMKSCADILAYSEYVQELLISDSAKHKYELYPYVMEMISSITTSNPDIYSVFFVNNDNRKVSDPVRNDDGIIDELDAHWQIRNGTFNKPAFLDRVQGNRSPAYTYVFPVFHSYLNGDGRKIGCGIFVLDTLYLANAVRVEDATEHSRFLLLDRNNHIIVSSDGTVTDIPFDAVFWETDDASSLNDRLIYQGQKTIAQMQTVESTGWRIISLIPVGELTADIYSLFMWGLGFSMLMVAVICFLHSATARSVSEPVGNIATFLTEMEKDGSLHHRLSIPYANESGDIARSINLLLDKVEEVTQKNLEQQSALYNARLEEKQAMLLALQSQVNPHFLYNTLNCMSSIGLAYGSMEVAAIASAMSDIFRYSIKGDHIVTVRDEMECIRKYLKIMEIRYPDRFTATIRVEPELLDCAILKMTLQPIVENSMRHGLEQCLSHGELLIEGKQVSEHEMVFTVQDNGKGMSEKTLQAVIQDIEVYEHNSTDATSSFGLGLRNINRRIKLQAGPRYGLRLISTEGKGTSVVLTLPLADLTPAPESTE